MANTKTNDQVTEITEAPKIIPGNFDEDDTFNNHDPLSGRVIERDYATTGNISSEQDDPIEVPDRVEDFNFEDFDPSTVSADETMDDPLSSGQEPSVSNDDSPSSQETVLAKKAQAQIVKSQSKKIVNMYCFVVLWGVRKSCKVPEQRIILEEEKGTLSAQQIIMGSPLIQHIRNANQTIEDLDFDPDQREELREALEMYMIAQNISTSPGMNLALAAIVPTISIFAKGMQIKSEMKSLIKSVQALHLEQTEKTAALHNELQVAVERTDQLHDELREATNKTTEINNRNQQLESELESLRKKVSPDPERSRATRQPKSSGSVLPSKTATTTSDKKATSTSGGVKKTKSEKIV